MLSYRRGSYAEIRPSMYTLALYSMVSRGPINDLAAWEGSGGVQVWTESRKTLPSGKLAMNAATSDMTSASGEVYSPMGREIPLALSYGLIIRRDIQ